MDDRERGALAARVVEIVRQTAAHYGLWMAEAVHQVGLEQALDAEKEAGDRLTRIMERKLAKALGLERGADLLAGLDGETLAALEQALGTGWLAADGVWFQAIEHRFGMTDAKRVNDSCWARFAPYEAARAMAVLGIEPGGGLDALERCLAARMVATINTWEVADRTPTSFVFRITNCRVQAARKRKGMQDYPCKSGGLVEYRGLAHTVDPRIRTECVACPPDEHPEEWFCAWRFTLEE
ncbi:DUF6125 family protein [Desulfocurvus sp. DL9XJH121]